MAIRIRRGLDADRLSVILEEGEFGYSTDTQKVYIGDGSTPGGNEVGGINSLADLSDVDLTGLTADQILKYDGIKWINWTPDYYTLPSGGTSSDYIDGTGAIQAFPTYSQADRVVTSVRNETGSTVPAGSVVYLNGASGNKPLIQLAQANTEMSSTGTYGVTQSSIANNNNGTVVVIGTVSNLDTSAYTAGNILWLSPTVAGGYTITKPSAPNHAVYVAIVTRSHATQGTIEVKIQNGYELQELHNVSISSPSDNDGLFYEVSTSLWKNKSIAVALGFTPENVANKSTTLDADKLSNTKYPSVKSVYDWATGLFATLTQLGTKQDTLVSGTNIKTINSTTLLGSGDVVIDKSSVGLGNVANVDTTNASNITSGTLGDARLSTNVTTQGNTFNAANKLVQLDGTAKLPAVDGSQLTNLPSFTPPNGLLKLASAISTTFQNVTDYLANASVLFLNSRRIGIGKDTSVTTQSVAVVEVQDTNTSIVLKPNGTGGIIASVPDGTATGGNARGQYSVDLQQIRGNISEVASGNYSFIGGGRNNRATGANSSSFGAYNQATGGSSTAFGESCQATNSNTVAGGTNSIASGNTAISFGNANTASSNYSVVSGGQTNTASTNTHATVVGGQSNTASGNGSIAGGLSCISSGGNGSVALGNGSQATNAYTVALGYQAIASGAHSFAAIYGAAASGNSAVALGRNSKSNGINSCALNSGVAAGENSLAQGNLSETSTLNSSAFGLGSYTALNNQLSLGNYTGTYKGDSQMSRVTYPINTGSVSSGGTYTFTGAQLIIPKNATYGSGVTQAYLCRAKFIYGARNKSGTVTTINNKDCFSAIYDFAAKSTNGSGGALIGTPTLQTSFSDSNLLGTTISITIGSSGQILYSFTPPSWIGGGTIEFRGTLHLEFTEIGLF